MHLIFFFLIKVETSEEAVEEDEPASEDEVDEDDAERSWKRWPACWPASYSTADPADPNQLTTIRFHELFCCCAFCV